MRDHKIAFGAKKIAEKPVLRCNLLFSYKIYGRIERRKNCSRHRAERRAFVEEIF